jgi:hypothetical protein
MQLAYFQECCVALEWSSDVPSAVDSSNIDDRMGMIRRCFAELQSLDQKEYLSFSDYKSRTPWQTLPPVFVSNRILYGLARAALLIFQKHHENRGVVAEEWRNWHSQIVQSVNLEERLLNGQTNAQLQALEVAYRTALTAAATKQEATSQ